MTGEQYKKGGPFMKRKLSFPLFTMLLALMLILPLSFAKTAKADSGVLYSYTARVSDGYLALRNAQAYDYNNEIGKIYTGQTVEVYDYNRTSSTYWWVYAPTLGKSGYVNKNYLYGGTVIDDGSSYDGTTMTVRVSDGYLALRNAKAFDYNNEIGKLYTGDYVNVQDTSDSTYWWVYSPKLGKSGYVNRNYLVGGSDSTITGDEYTVKVSDGYLALRTAKAFDYSNEIGALYSGETVEVIDYLEGTYWWVYSPKLDRYGYVNKNYLVTNSDVSYKTYTVYVTDGYLALRNAQAYDYSNEIGKLYTGETVEVASSDINGNTYWWVYAPSLGKYGYVNRNYLY